MDFAAFIDSLQYMGYGMAGIFVIIGLMSLLVMLLRKLFPVKK